MESSVDCAHERPPTLVLVVGPIAGGKSTVSRALAQRLRQDGEQVALVELDQIAEMAMPTLPDWGIAHSIFGSVVGQWLRGPLSVVVAEGPGSESEVRGVLAEVSRASRVVTVILTSTFEVAYSRALEDPTRGISRERHFLLAEFDRWARDMLHIERDLLIDTGCTSVDESVALICGALERARG
jgi:hypothetical protein